MVILQKNNTSEEWFESAFRQMYTTITQYADLGRGLERQLLGTVLDITNYWLTRVVSRSHYINAIRLTPFLDMADYFSMEKHADKWKGVDLEPRLWYRYIYIYFIYNL